MTDEPSTSVTLSILFLFIVIIGLLIIGSYKYGLVKEEREWKNTIEQNIISNNAEFDNINNKIKETTSLAYDAWDVGRVNNNHWAELEDKVNLIVIPEYDKIASCTLVMNNESNFDAKCQRVKE